MLVWCPRTPQEFSSTALNPDGVAQERGDHPSGRGGKQLQGIYTLHSWAGEEPWSVTLFVMLCYVHQPETQQFEVIFPGQGHVRVCGADRCLSWTCAVVVCDLVQMFWLGRLEVAFASVLVVCC